MFIPDVQLRSKNISFGGTGSRPLSGSVPSPLRTAPTLTVALDYLHDINKLPYQLRARPATDPCGKTAD